MNIIDRIQIHKRQRIILGITASFILFLVSSSELTKLTLPCLRPLPGISYDDASCTLDLAMSHYLALVMVGFVLVILGVFMLRIIPRIKNLLIFAVVLGVCVVIAFHVHIPTLEKAINKAPITIFDPAAAK